MHLELMTIQAVVSLKLNHDNARGSSLGSPYSLGLQSWIPVRLESLSNVKLLAIMVTHII